MIKSNVTTLVLDGGETAAEFERGHAYYQITNKGDTDFYVSLSPNIVPEAEGVYTVAAGGSEIIGEGYSFEKFYIMGTGKAYIRGKRDAMSTSFKRGGKGGEKKSISGQMGYATEGLMCHYSADKAHFSSGWRINDLSGNGNAGLFFQLSDRRPVYLTNSGNYINLNQKYIIMPQMDYEQITLEAVCRFPSTPTQEVDILSNLEAGGYCIFYNAAEKKFCGYVRIAGAYEKVLGADNDFLTHLFTVTYDNRSIKLYVDGQLADETEIAGSIDFPSADTVLAVNANPYGGNAQENYLGIGSFNFYAARVYSRALSDEEVLQNFSVDRDLFWKN